MADPKIPHYNHACTLAYVVISTDPKGATTDEHMAALRERLAKMEADPQEAEDAVQTDRPFDTFEIEDSPST